MDMRQRLQLIDVEEEVHRLRTMAEAHARARWTPPGEDKAAACPLAPCRRHRACQSDAVRRACEKIALAEKRAAEAEATHAAALRAEAEAVAEAEAAAEAAALAEEKELEAEARRDAYKDAVAIEAYKEAILAGQPLPHLYWPKDLPLWDGDDAAKPDGAATAHDAAPSRNIRLPDIRPVDRPRIRHLL